LNNTHSTIETANNYGYDELGNLVRDAQEEIASIEWTVYGKMKKITRTGASSKADLEFGYDASGNRLWKKVTPKGSGAVISTYYYLRDAQGNEMCRYVKYTNPSSQLMYVAQEHSIYGSSRVGVDNRKDTLYKAGSYSPAWGGANTSRRALGLKSFELSNHLGNVLVTVSDKPVYKVSSGTIYFNPEITSTSDYYPFGAPINGRGYSSEAYRFSINGQEKTDEISGAENHTTALYWEYDTRLGRRWNTDPVVKPWESLYACFSNNPIWGTDVLGDSSVFSNKGDKLHYDPKDKDLRVFMKDGDKLTQIGELGKKVDGNKILGNVLKDNKAEAKKGSSIDWFNNVKKDGKWDYKDNENTIFGIAWDYDLAKNKQTGKEEYTFFSYKNFGQNRIFNSADVGNYNAGYTGTHCGIPMMLQRIGAGHVEQLKQNFNRTMWDPIYYTKEVLLDKYWGDRPRDHYFNTQGMKDAQTEKDAE
jgi:hypothetical protein